MNAILPTALAAAPSLTFLKPAEVNSPSTNEHLPGSGADQQATGKIVQEMLSRLEKGREEECLRMAQKFDKWTKPTVEMTAEDIRRCTAALPEQMKADIRFQHDRVRDFAKQQVASIKGFTTELYPGVSTGQRVVPVECAGCYVPGGHFSHVSSAIMSVTTAKASGVNTVIACSPPYGDTQLIHPATLYALSYAGADRILCLGGVHGIAALAYGLFTGIEADILVGPGNKWVAEAKRILFGRVGIDMIAGPTEIAILADDSADPLIVAYDLLSQAEHGLTSPVWLITTSRRVGEQVIQLMPSLIDDLIERDPTCTARISWRDFGEVVLVANRDEMAALSDLYAAEHLEVHCQDLDWYLSTLRNYGSLFLGEETCVPYGDKCTGPNHILPTRRVARYSGGLSADKFLKKLTWQRMTRAANKDMGVRASRISRIEGMEGHALSGDARLAKYFPNDTFDLMSNPQRIASVQKFRDDFEKSRKSKL
eukprot:m.178494 g.178494  ORF g.178494 m.178494 type:complete len:482 (-) comp31942_c0_seq2:92-1537(-)